MILFLTEPGDKCITPNEEEATCMPISGCDIIREALKSRIVGAAEFARKSQCGRIGHQPLVCCGTSTRLIPVDEDNREK